ncbi:hypothetical protein Tco_1076981 [Tanacetum coccineum]
MDTTQDSRDSLEGTNGNEGDQVQTPHDSPLSGGHTYDRAKGTLNLHELSVLCTNLSNRVLALESIKDAQAAEISALKSRIKKLEKKCKPSISHHRAWLKSVNRLPMKKKFGKKESVSKQGRKKSKPESTLDDSTVFDDQDADHDKSSGDKGGNAKELVSTARPEVSTARPGIDAARQEDSAMKKEQVRKKELSIKDVDEFFKTCRSILTLTANSNNSFRLQKMLEIASWYMKRELADWKEKRGKTETGSRIVEYIASFIVIVQAKMVLVKVIWLGLQLRERMHTNRRKVNELLADFFKRRKNVLADDNSATYFVPIGSERDEKMIDKMNKKAAGMDEEEVPEEPESTKVEVKQEGREENIRKRSGRRLKMKATKKSKRQKTDSDLEEEEQLRASLKIVPDEEEEIDYEVLGTRYPIVNWESAFYHTDRYGVPHDYYRVFRANGSSRYIKTFTEMVSRFDRLDFIELHSLVMQRFSTTTPEGIDLVLWGDLRIMFEETADDDIWKNQEKWIIKSWTFYENCGVHILALEDGTKIHMLAERRYPLIRETTERMIELRLTVESEGEAVFDLLRFIQK